MNEEKKKVIEKCTDCDFFDEGYCRCGDHEDDKDGKGVRHIKISIEVFRKESESFPDWCPLGK